MKQAMREDPMDGVRRSIEDSLQRLGVDSLDIAFVHDISPDFAFFPNGWEEQYDISRKGAFPTMLRQCRPKGARDNPSLSMPGRTRSANVTRVERNATIGSLGCSWFSSRRQLTIGQPLARLG